MKKYFFLFPSLLLIFSSNIVFSKPVDAKQAQKVAFNFLYSRADNNLKTNLNLVLYKTISDDNSKKELYYIFNISPKGFIIVTADDNLIPVIGYSFEDNYTENKNPVQELWVKRQIKLATQNIEDDISNNKKWLSLSNNTIKSGIKSVTPLCTTKWDQGMYYNYLCPTDSTGPGGHAYAGCVATAMGQVMKYWNYPTNGYSGYAYQHIWPMHFHDYGVVSANFGATTYNWTNMPNTITNFSKIDIATLLFHCGVSVKMDYGPDGSGAQTDAVPFALNHYFKYNQAITYINHGNISRHIWDSIIMNQLDKGFPMVYSGSDSAAGDAHAWVVDGYQDSSYFHINWGWSGANNGYFYLTDLNSGNGDFTKDQAAVINIFPQDYVSIEDHQSKQLSLYPNPAKDYFVIDNINNDFDVEIITINGKTIRSISNDKIINTSDIANGIYFVKITQNAKHQIVKLLILK